MGAIIFWSACFVSFGLGAMACWAFLARPAIARAYFNGGFDSFPEHFEKGRTAGYASGQRRVLINVAVPEGELCCNLPAALCHIDTSRLYVKAVCLPISSDSENGK